MEPMKKEKEILNYNLNECECRSDNSSFELFKAYIGLIDETVAVINEACSNIISGVGSHCEADSIYGHLKQFETAFSQMAELALSCQNSQQLAQPIIEKSEKVPIVNMVEVAGSNFLNNIFQKDPYYYQYLYYKYPKHWQEVDHYPK